MLIIYWIVFLFNYQKCWLICLISNLIKVSQWKYKELSTNFMELGMILSLWDLSFLVYQTNVVSRIPSQKATKRQSFQKLFSFAIDILALEQMEYSSSAKHKICLRCLFIIQMELSEPIVETDFDVSHFSSFFIII